MTKVFETDAYEDYEYITTDILAEAFNYFAEDCDELPSGTEVKSVTIEITKPEYEEHDSAVYRIAPKVIARVEI